MKKRVRWLLSEVQSWVADGVISIARADTIKGRYVDGEQGIAWNRMIFLIAGAILMGLGVTLFGAYNWDKIPKFMKLAGIFLSLAAAHISALAIERPEGQRKFLSLALHLLGTMLFGSGIWLVAQIYHIDEHYPTAFLIWGIGALALGWILPSVAHGIVASMLFLLWSYTESFNFWNPNLLGPLVILLGVLPLAWMMRSPTLMSSGLLAYLFTLVATLTRFHQDSWAPILAFNGMVILGAGKIMSDKGLSQGAATAQRVIGETTYFAALYALTFPGLKLHVSLNSPFWQETIYFLVFAVAAAMALVYVLLSAKDRLRDGGKFLENGSAIFAFLVLVVIVVSACRTGFGGWVKASYFNLLFLGQSILLISMGCRDANFRTALTGCLLLALLTVTRYVDLFESLLTRSILFLLLGSVLFTVGILYFRRKSAKGGITS